MQAVNQAVFDYLYFVIREAKDDVMKDDYLIEPQPDKEMLEGLDFLNKELLLSLSPNQFQKAQLDIYNHYENYTTSYNVIKEQARLGCISAKRNLDYVRAGNYYNQCIKEATDRYLKACDKLNCFEFN